MLKLVCIYCILPFSSGKCFILLELICLAINFGQVWVYIFCEKDSKVGKRTGTDIV